jgi:Flp pilus assembly protein TadD
MGLLLVREGRYAEAEHALRVSLENTSLKKNRVELYNDIGHAAAAQGKSEDAIVAYQDSLKLSPAQPEIQTELGQRFFRDQRFDQATVAFENAIRLNPDNSEAQSCLGMILQSQGHDSEAIPHYRKAIEVDPHSFIILNNLSWLLATDPNPALRDGPEAVRLAQQACQQTGYKAPSLLGTLAAAYAEAGRFTDAIATAQKALKLTPQDSSLQTQLKVYQSGKPFRDTSIAGQ